ncbi:SMC family ATPase [Deinococcus sonorensis]|uniref:SMC family ATPase n=2 Tax=Deinococcus sonorensis TaxID=309891 RepID=A0AAU7UBI7_9DEIO
MRPLALSVQGFMPFRAPQHLSFDGLDLFAIVGPTGSGKSALLDAMTFALYGRTPRLGGSGMEALISQGASGCAVELEFEVRGQRYRVARSRGRKSSGNQVKFEQWLAPEGRWQNLSTDSKVAQTDARIEEAVGLDYTAFTRAVLLPQGEFSSFLKGKNADRQKLLGELMNMSEVADMAKFARDRTRQLDLELKGAQTRLEREYGDISPEVLAGWQADQVAAHTRIETLDEQRGQLTLSVQRLREVQQSWSTIQRLQAGVQRLEQQAGAVREGAERAAAARRVAGVLPLLDVATRAEQAAARAAGELRRQQADAAEARRTVEAATARLTTAETQAAGIPALRQRSEQLREGEALAQRLRRAGGRPDAQHAQPLPWDEEQHAEAHAAAERQKRNSLERVQLDAARSAHERRAADLATEELTQRRELAELERLKGEGVRLKQDADATKARLTEAEAHAGVQAFRHLLHLGEPCPLCEQGVQHLPSTPAPDLSPLRDQLARQEQTLETLRERCKQLMAETRVRARTLAEGQQQLQEERQHLQAREQDLQLAEASVTGQPAELAARLLAGLAGLVRQAGPDPAAALRRCQEQIEQLGQAVEAARVALARASSTLSGAEARLEAAQVVASDRQQEGEAARHAAQSGLTELRLSEAEARAAALPEAQIAAFEEAVQQHQQERVRLEAELREQQRKLGGQDHDPAALGAAERKLAATETELNAAREHAGRLAEQLRSGRERLARKGELEAEAQRTSSQLDTWKTLSGSLAVGEFQQYLLQEVESRLLSGAGQLLYDISDQRYRLGLQDGDYVVQDLWNAGEARAVRTLSGGETFLASLSLAIALSDYLAGNQVLGALFLDEGFGTLDPQALEAVAGALENLRTSGRMVGVITHIESLSERLPVHLLVSKSTLSGSTVQRLDT